MFTKIGALRLGLSICRFAVEFRGTATYGRGFRSGGSPSTRRALLLECLERDMMSCHRGRFIAFARIAGRPCDRRTQRDDLGVTDHRLHQSQHLRVFIFRQVSEVHRSQAVRLASQEARGAAVPGVPGVERLEVDLHEAVVADLELDHARR